MEEKVKKSCQELIYDALFDLLQNNNYDQITVKDICEKAHISRMSFYRLYKQKDDILTLPVGKEVDNLIETINKNPDIKDYDFVLFMFRYLEKYKRELAMLSKSKKLGILLDAFYPHWKLLLTRCGMVSYKSSKDNPLSLPFIVGGSFTILKSWINSSFKETPEQMAYYAVHIMDKK